MGGTGRRVALIANRLTVGGLERVVLELARGLGKHGWEPHVLCLESGGAYADAVRDAGVPVTVLGARVELGARGVVGAAAVVARVMVWMARVQPAVVQTHLFYAQALGGMAARALGVRAIVHAEQNFYAWKGAAARAVERAALGTRGVVVTPTAVLARHHRARLGAGRDVRVIPNGVAPGERSSAWRRRLGAGPRDVLVGLAERLVPAKRQDVFLAAARQAARVEPRLRFALVGDGPARGELAARAAEGPLRGRVAFAGEVADAGPLVGAFDLYATASTMEGFGIAPVEALARGVPVVAPATDVFRETILPTCGAVLTVPESADDLAQRLVALARAGDLRGRMGEAGARAARARWSLDGMIAAYAALYLGQTGDVDRSKLQG